MVSSASTNPDIDIRNATVDAGKKLGVDFVQFVCHPLQVVLFNARNIPLLGHICVFLQDTVSRECVHRGRKRTWEDLEEVGGVLAPDVVSVVDDDCKEW